MAAAASEAPAPAEQPQSQGPAPSTPEAQAPAVPITATPQAGQLVAHEGKLYTTIREGQAYILIPPGTATTLDPKAQAKAQAEAEAGTESKQQVFYNPIQQFNRDLSVLAIRAFGEDLLGERRKRREREAEREGKRRERARAKGAEKGAEKVGKRKIEDVTEGEAEQGAENGLKRLRKEEAHDGYAAGEEQGNAATPADSVAKAQDTPVPQDGHTDATNGEPNGKSSNGPKFRILDALSASGLRALRYSQELPFNTSVTGNDLSAQATQAMRVNIQHNRLEDKITPVTGNAMAHMYSLTGQEGIGGPGPRYDVIDLDPYGTAVPFLDGAVQAVADGGLLCVTCTDAGVWASHGYLEKTYSQYGGLPLKGLHSHEGGLRLILHSIATAAARYGISIEPLLSLSIDFYARVFVRVRKSPAEVKFLAGKTMLVYNCDAGCGAWQTQYLARNVEQTSKNGTSFFKHSFAQGPSAPPLCPHCGFKTHLSGPMYGGPLHNPAFIEKILGYLPDVDKETYATTERIEGMLTTAQDETLWDDERDAPRLAEDGAVPRMRAGQQDLHPFYFNPSALAKVLHCQAPSDTHIKGALRHAGFKAVRSHTKRSTIKTDAPWEVLWEVMREWVRQKAPIKEGAIREGTAGWNVMKRSRRVPEPVAEEMHKQQGESATGGAAADTESTAAASTDAKPTAAASTDAATDAATGAATNAVSTEAADGAEAGAAPAEAKKTRGDRVTGDARKARGETTGDAVSAMQVVFDERLGKERERKRLVRYQQNPRANWGPMNRAK